MDSRYSFGPVAGHDSTTPVEVRDEYDNPATRLDYGPAAPRREIRGFFQPRTSSSETEQGRQAITGTAWVHTVEPIGRRERLEYLGRVYQVDGEPDRWEPGPGRVHHGTSLICVEG